jgi:hypothetical protein
MVMLLGRLVGDGMNRGVVVADDVVPSDTPGIIVTVGVAHAANNHPVSIKMVTRSLLIFPALYFSLGG